MSSLFSAKVHFAFNLSAIRGTLVLSLQTSFPCRPALCLTAEPVSVFICNLIPIKRSPARLHGGTKDFISSLKIIPRHVGNAPTCWTYNSHNDLEKYLKNLYFHWQTGGVSSEVTGLRVRVRAWTPGCSSREENSYLLMSFSSLQFNKSIMWWNMPRSAEMFKIKCHKSPSWFAETAHRPPIQLSTSIIS